MNRLKQAIESAKTTEQVRRGIPDEVGKFFSVFTPTGESELIDILFEGTIGDLLLQIKGGLDMKRIEGFFKSKPKAEALAKKLLARQ